MTKTVQIGVYERDGCQLTDMCRQLKQQTVANENRTEPLYLGRLTSMTMSRCICQIGSVSGGDSQRQRGVVNESKGWKVERNSEDDKRKV